MTIKHLAFQCPACSALKRSALSSWPKRVVWVAWTMVECSRSALASLKSSSLSSAVPESSGTRIWLYKRPFRIGWHEGMVLLDARSSGLFSALWLDGEEVAHDFTPAAGR